MAASLWSSVFGVGLVSTARACRCSRSAVGLHAIRAGRLSSLRYASSAVQEKPTLEPTQELATDSLNAVKEIDRPTANSDQPKFDTLQGVVAPRTLKALTGRPFNLVHMSSVQAAVLPLLPDLIKPPLEDGTKRETPRDLMVKARTGTGKTLAFLVPAVESRLHEFRVHTEQVMDDTMSNNKTLLKKAIHQYAKKNVGTLILSPTRELATQIANEAIKLTEQQEDFEVRLFTGGLPKRQQLREWHLGRRDIVVATPGRLLDFIENEPGFKEDLQSTQMLILDEADTLLEMGFREDISAISKHLKDAPERQTFLFSATISKGIQQIAREILSEDHKYVNCVPNDAPPTHAQIPQYYTAVPSPEEQLPHVLRLIAEDQLANPGKSKVLIFLSTTRMVKLYSTLINELGPLVLPAGARTRFAEMHSKKNMNSRINTSDWYRRDNSGASVMLTSDVSARGVDYPGVTRVIQVGVPATGDAYVHRVGRTGRGHNMSGRADLVLLPWELGFLSWQLTDIPIKELPTNELIARVTELAEKYDADPTSFLPRIEKDERNRRRGHLERTGFQPEVALRLADIHKCFNELQPKLEREEVVETLTSMLAFYSSNAGTLRVQKNVTIAGVNQWAEALLGEKTQLRIPREFLESRPRQSRPTSYKRDARPGNRWEGRGSTSVRRERNWDERPQWQRNQGREDQDDSDSDAHAERERPGRDSDSGERRFGGQRRFGGDRDRGSGGSRDRSYGGNRDRGFGGDRDRGFSGSRERGSYGGDRGRDSKY
ncbi:P-loop containing nucleoside triphosphate hydrolase protein [Daedaleopsis nitida]|nr:P-loop containing nucleoside triphosphate hydrolase protein [Daedaleopsis nitida]